MATCKDCFHHDVCADFRRNICEIDQRRFEEYKINSDGLCGNFKNKACFVELPCKVGDTVYQIIGHYDYIRECEVVGFHLGEFSDLRGHKRKPYLICRSDSSRYLSHLDIDKIGKTVFLTREDAEAALKERGTT